MQLHILTRAANFRFVIKFECSAVLAEFNVRILLLFVGCCGAVHLRIDGLFSGFHSHRQRQLSFNSQINHQRCSLWFVRSRLILKIKMTFCSLGIALQIFLKHICSRTERPGGISSIAICHDTMHRARHSMPRKSFSKYSDNAQESKSQTILLAPLTRTSRARVDADKSQDTRYY